MSGATNYLEAQLLNTIFRSAAAYKPAGIYIALFTANPTDAGGGTEVTGGNYSRKQVTQADANWNAPAGTPRQISNVNDITWSAVTWSGTVTGWGVYDASTAGNLLFWYDSANIIVASGNDVKFVGGNPGGLAVQAD